MTTDNVVRARPNEGQGSRHIRGWAAILVALALFAVTLVAPPAQAAEDSKGADFWLTFPGNLGTPELTLFITGDTNTTGTVEIPGLAFTTPFAVTAGTVTSVVVPSGAQITTSDAVEDKGIHVTALDEVTVYGLTRIQATTDAYLGLPTDILGTEYIVLGYKNTNVVNATQFAVVGTQNATTVTITPSVTTGARAAGVPYNITLDQGQTYQLRNTNAAPADLSGTIVTADKPIAAFGGHQCANIPAGNVYCDNIVEQLPPTSTWGKEFGTVPLATRTGGDTFRFLASTDATTVSVNGAPVATLNRGQLHEQLIAGNARITSDQPILVAQYSNSTSFDNVTSDPFEMLTPPLEQFLASYTVTTPTSGFALNFVNLVVPNSAVGAVTIDGVPVPAGSYSPIPGTSFSGAQVEVTVGAHNLDGPLPFGVSVYGFANADSYGYPGGLSLSPIAEVASVTVAPKTATNPVNTEHCVTATVLDQNNAPLEGIRVDFAVTGVNATVGFAFTDASGLAAFCYTGANAGVDTITASVGTLSDTASKTWTSGQLDDESVSGTKYYDANANGQLDVGEAGIEDWIVDVNDGGATTSVATDAAGEFSLNVDPGSFTVAEQQAAGWIQTGNSVDQSGGTGDTTLNADMTYSVDLDAGETATGLNFGNLCIGDGGARSKGFWGNKNGKALFDTDSTDALAALVALNLRNEDGTHFNPTSWTQLERWLKNAGSVNQAYMLSAQLAAMALNVHFGLVDSGALILAEGSASANAAGFASVAAIMAEANASLGADGNTPAGDPNRAIQGVLSDILDAANNNRTFVQAGSGDCPTPDFPASSSTLYADGSVACSGADDTSQPTGTVSFDPTQDAVNFNVDLTGLEPGIAYNVVISEDGDCNPVFYDPAGTEFTVGASGNVSYSGSFAAADGTYNLLVNVVATTVPIDPKEREIATTDTNVVIL